MSEKLLYLKCLHKTLPLKLFSEQLLSNELDIV